MIRAILYHERLNFALRGPAFAVIIVIAAALIYAGISGAAWRDARAESLAEFDTQRLVALATWRADLAAIETGERVPSPYDANPMGITFPATLPASSLGDFAIGHADLHPAAAEISPWRNLSSMFGRYQFDNPTTLSTSRFDMALVIVLLMPILMIAVSFDVLAGERDRGALAMIMSFPIRLATLVWTRLAFRNGILWLAAIVVMSILVLVNGEGADRLARFGLWVGVSVVYGLFWLTAIALCVAFFKTTMRAAAALVAGWMVFTLAVPAGVATLAEAAYPTPSRLAYLSEIREAQADTNRELSEVTAGFLLDHPELSVGDEGLPSYFRAAFLSSRAARDNTRPIVEEYETARAGRSDIVRWAQYLSPSVVAQRLLYLAAGADLERQHAFQAQARTALDTLGNIVGPAVVSRNRISVAEFDRLTPFSFREVPPRVIAASAAGPLLFLLVLSVVCGTFAQRRLSSVRLNE